MLADKDLDLANPSAMGVAEDELRMTILRRRKRFDEISRLFLPLDLNQIHHPHFFTDAKLRKGCIESLYDGRFCGNLSYYCNKLLNPGDNDAFLGANMYNAYVPQTNPSFLSKTKVLTLPGFETTGLYGTAICGLVWTFRPLISHL